MKLAESILVSELANMLGAKLIGDPNVEITHLNEIHKVCKGSLIFVDNEKYYTQAIYSTASAILIDQAVDCPPIRPFWWWNAPLRPIIIWPKSICLLHL